MAVNVADLSVALRLSADGSDLDIGQTAILTRLLGVGDAHVELLIPSAPDSIKDEVRIRLAAYLYDQPIGRRDAFANGWVNSGAGSLASRWETTRSTAPSRSSAGGLDMSAVEALIEAHRAIADAHHDPPAPQPGTPVVTQQAQLWVTNAQLKTLDTDFLEIVPSPGAGRYIQVEQVWLQKHGTDAPSPPSVNFSNRTNVAFMVIHPGITDRPLNVWRSGDDYATPESIRLWDLLDLDDGVIWARNVGSVGLVENQPLHLGITAQLDTSAYTEAAWDAFLTGIDDVTLGITVRYQVHDASDLPQEP